MFSAFIPSCACFVFFIYFFLFILHVHYTIQIPHGVALSTWESYLLSVNGTGGAQFSEMRYIRFMEKGFTIYIQTDKAVYKPGQNGIDIKIAISVSVNKTCVKQN